jgi:hypothetical protein
LALVHNRDVLEVVVEQIAEFSGKTFQDLSENIYEILQIQVKSR